MFAGENSSTNIGKPDTKKSKSMSSETNAFQVFEQVNKVVMQFEDDVQSLKAKASLLSRM